jgi:hypothetical protein
MAENNTGATKTFHLANNITVLVIVLVAIAAFIGGWYGGTRHNKASTGNKTASSLAIYKNQDNGFQLQYPTDWGSPNFTSDAAGGTKHYALSFNKASFGNLNYNITISMGQGTSQGVTSSNDVKTVLKNKRSSVTISDNSSYATVAAVPQLKVSSLSETQIVNLSKISVTAATLTYQITGGLETCSQNKFAASSTGGCIAKTDYDTVNQVLKSLRSL